MKEREEEIEALILRSILGETSPDEERELAEAYAKQPDLFMKRRELAEMSRLLSEAHGVAMNDIPSVQVHRPLWIRTLRAITPIAGGIAACLLFFALLVPQVGSVRQNQQPIGSIVEYDHFDAPQSEMSLNEEVAPPLQAPQESSQMRKSGGGGGQVSNQAEVASEDIFALFGDFDDSTNFGADRSDLRRENVALPASNVAGESNVGSITRGAVRQSAPQAENEEFMVSSGLELARQKSASSNSTSTAWSGPSQPFGGTGFKADKETLKDNNVPILGDAPLLARLFASDASQRGPVDQFAASSESEPPADSFSVTESEMAGSFASSLSGNTQTDSLRSTRERKVEEDLYDSDDRLMMAEGGESSDGQLAYRDELSEAPMVSSMSAPMVTSAPVAPSTKPAPARQLLPKKAVPPPVVTFTNPAVDPFSTFSLNVTDVSFQLAAIQLAQGLSPNPASIRAEEFYNAFDYRDPAPAPGQPIRFEAESANLPAGQNLKVVRLSVKTASQGRAASKPAQITFAVDHSGSMQRDDRKNTVNAALAQIPAALGPNDRVNIITFATNPRVELLQSSPSNSAGIGSALNSAPEGGTNLENGLTTAYEVATRFFNPAYENRVVLLSDGIANLGQIEADQLNSLIEKNRIQGIAFDGFGIGWENLNDPLLSELASNGDGQYAFLNSPEDAETTFVRTLSGSIQSSVRDVKVQVEWNADRVESFRLVGYETHLLKKEEFRDDTVDAAEMAPEQAGNAIYLIELKADGKGPLGTARVRFKEERGDASEERSWIIPNPPAWPEIDAASPGLQLATSAAVFADKLQDANRFPTINRSKLLTWVQNSQAYFNNPPEVETLAMMIRNATFLR